MNSTDSRVPLITGFPTNTAGSMTIRSFMILTVYQTPGRHSHPWLRIQRPEITNPKGDVKFTVKDGTLAGYELHVTGSVSFNGNSRDVDRTTTVTISDAR